MPKHLQQLLEQLRVVRVQVHSYSAKKQVNLFEVEVGPDISFNDCRTLLDYQNQLDHFYYTCKLELEEILNKSYSDPEGLKRILDFYRFEVREFKNRYFPKDNELVIFNRVHLVKTSRSDLNENTSLKKKFFNFSMFSSN